MKLFEYFFADQIRTAFEYLDWFVGTSLVVAGAYVTLLLCSLFIPGWRHLLGLINKVFGVGVMLLILVAAGFLYSMTPQTVAVAPSPPVVIELPELPEIEMPPMDVPEMPDIDWEAFWGIASNTAAAVAETVDEVFVSADDAIEQVVEAAKPKPPTLEEIRAQQEKLRKERIESEFYSAYLEASAALTQEVQGRTSIERLPDVFNGIEDDLFSKLYSSFYEKPVSRKTPDTPFRPNRPDYMSLHHGVNYCIQQAGIRVNHRTDQLTVIDRGTIRYQQERWMDEALKEELQYFAKKLRGKWVEEIAATYAIHLPQP